MVDIHFKTDKELKIIDCSDFLKEVGVGGSAGMKGNIIDGGYAGIENASGEVDRIDPADEDTDQLHSVDNLLATCVLAHLSYRFPELACYKDWRELNPSNIKQEIIDNLRLLLHSKNFGICPPCPVCKDLQA